jgi:citrate lyase subunit beta/citryl-CoA lyase
VFNDFSNESGLIAECEQGRMLGFDGKSLIHPAQVDPANRIFAPSTEALEKAQKIVEAFALLGNLNKGVIKIEGQMTERLHLEQAMALLAQQAAIDAANR